MGFDEETAEQLVYFEKAKRLLRLSKDLEEELKEYDSDAYMRLVSGLPESKISIRLRVLKGDNLDAIYIEKILKHNADFDKKQHLYTHLVEFKAEQELLKWRHPENADPQLVMKNFEELKRLRERKKNSLVSAAAYHFLSNGTVIDHFVYLSGSKVYHLIQRSLAKSSGDKETIRGITPPMIAERVQEIISKDKFIYGQGKDEWIALVRQRGANVNGRDIGSP